MQSLSEGRVVVAVDQFDAGVPDRTAERVFILSSEDAFDVDLPIYLEVAEVVIRKNRLLITALDHPRAIGVFLADIEPADVEGRLANDLVERYGDTAENTIDLVAGYGLADFRGEFALPIEAWPPKVQGGNFLKPKGWENALATKGGCQSGGPGSSSCSVTCVTTGCGVSCQEGYYACCSCGMLFNDACTCIKDGNCGLHPCEP